MPRQRRKKQPTMAQVREVTHLAASHLVPAPAARTLDDYAAALPPGVRLGPSSIAGAGVGAFATCAMPQGVLLGEYTGKLVPASTSGPYVLDLGVLDAAVDAEDTRWGDWTRYVNGAKPGSTQIANTRFIRGFLPDGLYTIFVQTTGPVAAGSELLCDYGLLYGWTD